MRRFIVTLDQLEKRIELLENEKAVLEKKIRTLEDVEAIKNMHKEYVYWLNNRQWDKMLGCFIENASADIGYHGMRRGIREIEKLFKVDVAKVNSGREGHFAVQPVISVNGDKAKGHWLLYILFSDAATGQATKWIQGRYECEYVKELGKWKFSSVIWIRPWPKQPE